MRNALSASAILVAFAACVEETGNAVIPMTENIPPMAGNSVEEDARVNCMAAVTRTTGNNETSIISSEFSEAGTRVVVGIGENQAPWDCIAYTDGTTTQPTRLTGMDFL